MCRPRRPNCKQRPAPKIVTLRRPVSTPKREARKRWQAQLEASQALTHAALQEQATLAAGVGEAMCEWFKQANGAAADNSPLAQMWSVMTKQMAAACAAMQDANQQGGRHDL